MPYSTPTYDAGMQQNQLTTQKGQADIAQQYGTFLSQERHRRGLADANRTFKERFPQIGSAYNRRGMYQSGIRRGGQQKEASAYQRGVNNMNYDYGVQTAQDAQQQTFRDAQYQDAMLHIIEQMQKARAAGYDPFANVQGMY